MNEDKENEVKKIKSKRSKNVKNDQEVCGRCGKTPRTTKKLVHNNTPQQTINLLKSDKPSKKCKSRCKHKEELAKYTNVSVTTAESCSDSDHSYASTVCTHITQRSIRSIVRETTAKQEIARLQAINNQLTVQLDALAKGVTIRDLLNIKVDKEDQDKNDGSLYLDNTLTPGGDPAIQTDNIPLTITDNMEINHVANHVVDHVTPTNSPRKTPRAGVENGSARKLSCKQEEELTPTPDQIYTLKTPRSLPRSHHSSRSDIRVRKTPSPPERDPARKISSSPVNSDKVLDSGYTSVRINGVHSTTALGQINNELIQELEEENKALRSELRVKITDTQDIIALENEIRRLKSESNRYQCEVLRLKDVDLKLQQVEQFYHDEKKNFRCTIEDTLITLEDFRKDKESLEEELMQLEEKLKDAEQKKGSLRNELSESNVLLKNNVEKLKLELETRQSENAMLQTRISTVEENCSFLEGQVQALERDNHEKGQIVIAAEQHAKDMDRELAGLRKENAALSSEQHRIEPLENELEDLKNNVNSLKEENQALQNKFDKAEEESGQLSVRLSELVKSRTQLEEELQNKDRTMTSLQQELDSLKKKNTLAVNHAKEKEAEAVKESEDLQNKNEQLQEQMGKLKDEIEYIEQAFFRGWSDNLDEVSVTDERSVTFVDQTKSPNALIFPKATRIIQSIKLDRQKLKAKLVRSVQDSKTLQSQLHDTQEALERESAGLAKRVREALDKLEESEVRGHVLERTAKNLSIQVEEMNVVNKSLELENYHLKKLNETLSGGSIHAVTSTPTS